MSVTVNPSEWDFSGWATKANVGCSDGRVIATDAFAHCDGKVVPLVFNHQHNDINNVAGHAILLNKPEGVFAYGKFNNTACGKTAKELIHCGDITSLSIYANNLTQAKNVVLHGDIKELSIVLAGANPEAYITNPNLSHSGLSDTDTEAIIYYWDPIYLSHADEAADPEQPAEEEDIPDMTIKEVLESLNDDQREVFALLLAQAEDPNDTPTEDEIRAIGGDINTVLDSLNDIQYRTLGAMIALVQQQAGAEEIEDTSPAAEESEPEEESENQNEIEHSNDEAADPEQLKKVAALYKQYQSNNKNMEEDTMAHNAFENNTTNSLQFSDLVDAAKAAGGSLRDGLKNVLAHADQYGIDPATRNSTDNLSGAPVGYGQGKSGAEYGFANIDYLFPDAHLLNNEPVVIDERDEWVKAFMDKTTHSPFSRVKAVYADLSTEDIDNTGTSSASVYDVDTQAHGYSKASLKHEEVAVLLRRTAEPQTVYIKQKADRDDVLDITDFNFLAWQKKHMSAHLDRTIAIAAMFGDPRNAYNDGYINPAKIRPIWQDANLFTLNTIVKHTSGADRFDKAEELITAAILARVDYRGSGDPICFTTEEFLASALLIKDLNGHRIYKSKQELCTAMNVRDIVTVVPMKSKTRTPASTEKYLDAADFETQAAMSGSQAVNLRMVIMNPKDYTFGADKGGAKSVFDDFDLDYNQYKYLLETRCSGMNTVPFSAITIEDF